MTTTHIVMHVVDACVNRRAIRLLRDQQQHGIRKPEKRGVASLINHRDFLYSCGRLFSHDVSKYNSVRPFLK